MGGSGGTRTETTPTSPVIPPHMQPYMDEATRQAMAAMGANPLQGYMGPNVQQIPGLTPDEERWIGNYAGMAQSGYLTDPFDVGMSRSYGAADRASGSDFGFSPGQGGGGWGGNDMDPNAYESRGAGFLGQAGRTDPFEQLAGAGYQSGGALSDAERRGMSWLESQLDGRGGGYPQAGGGGAGADTNTRQMLRAEELAQQLTGGEVGQSPATLQAMKAWEEMSRPTMAAEMALTGNLGGGAELEAMELGRTAAMTPLLEKEIDTRQRTAQMLGDFGLGASGQELQASIANAQLATQASIANQQAALEWAGLDRNTAAQLASIGARGRDREISAASGLGQLGGQRAGRKAQVGQALGSLGGQVGGRRTQMRELGLREDLGRRGIELTAAQQAAAMGGARGDAASRAALQALANAGMPRDISTRRGQAEYNDFLRRQGLSEQLTLGPMGNYLAGILTPGSTVQSRQTGGGLFGS